MNSKTLGGILLALGIVLIAAGVVLMGVIVPGMKQFPDDVDTTRRYVGTMPVLLNAETFEFMTDLEVDLERRFATEETNDGVALVVEEQTLSHNGVPLQELLKRYAIDRKTMEWADDYPDDWAEMDGFWERGGLMLGWPIDTEKKDYQGWSDDYRNTVTLKFEGEIEHDRSGLDVYYYTAEYPPREIDPAQVQAVGLPLELPKNQFAALLEDADVSPRLKALLPGVLTAWEEDTVPLDYFYEYEGEYWIEPQTGMLIDTHKHELRKATLGQEFIDALPTLKAYIDSLSDEERAASRIPIFEIDYQGTDETVQDAKEDAQDAIDQIELFGTTIPIILIVVGFVLGAGGVFLFLRKPTPQAEA